MTRRVPSLFLQRVSKEANAAASKLQRFGTRLQYFGDFAEAEEAEELAAQLRTLAFDSLLEEIPEAPHAEAEVPESDGDRS